MNQTRNDIAENAREGMVAALNVRRAGPIGHQRAPQHAQWNVMRLHVIALHAMFDALEAGLAAHIDNVSERSSALGGTARGTVQTDGSATGLAPLPEGIAGGVGRVEAPADRTAARGASVRKGIDSPTELGDAADLLTGASRQRHKTLWLLEAHLQRG
jgi:starvation-inducible DNA-binding protein